MRIGAYRMYDMHVLIANDITHTHTLVLLSSIYWRQVYIGVGRVNCMNNRERKERERKTYFVLIYY